MEYKNFQMPDDDDEDMFDGDEGGEDENEEMEEELEEAAEEPQKESPEEAKPAEPEAPPAKKEPAGDEAAQEFLFDNDKNPVDTGAAAQQIKNLEGNN